MVSCSKLFLALCTIATIGLALFFFREQLTEDKEKKDQINSSENQIVGMYGSLAIVFISIGSFLGMLFVCFECKDRQRNSQVTF